MPIESNFLPEQAVEFLNEQDNLSQQVIEEVDVEMMRGELLQWCSDFIDRSKEWRKASFEDKWHRYRRDSEAIYDPQTARSKKDWQSKAFIPVTPSHRENIQAALFRMMVGARPPLEVKKRVQGESDQSDNIRDLTLREMEKSKFEVAFNNALDDATTYGDGFLRLRWLEKSEERLVRRPVYAPVDPTNPAQVEEARSLGPQTLGFSNSIEEVPVYRGVDLRHVSIWDLFPDPTALEIRGNTIAITYPITYGEVRRGVREGYFFPEAEEKLRDIRDTDNSEDYNQETKADRQITDTVVNRTSDQARLVCYELFARLPKKWVLGSSEDPEGLIPARIIFHKLAVLAIEVSEEYDGEPPIYQIPYFFVNGQFYNRGIPEMLKDLQQVVNESVNQRLDAVNLSLTKKYGAIEAALVSSKDFNDELGGVIRFDIKKMAQLQIHDIRSAFMELNTGTVDRAAFIDPQEMERYAQERSSANRVTLGTSGQVKDANQTLGGMELLRQSAGEKFAYIGMLMEFTALQDIFRAYWRAIYKNITPEDVENILGVERARRFELLSPETLDRDYAYIPQGVFTAENKALTQARLQSIVQLFGNEPWVDKIEIFDKIVKSNNFDPETLRLSPEEMQAMMGAQFNLQQASTPIPEPKPEPPGTPGVQVPQ